jgi:hypothetical protein
LECCNDGAANGDVSADENGAHATVRTTARAANARVRER